MSGRLRGTCTAWRPHMSACARAGGRLGIMHMRYYSARPQVRCRWTGSAARSVQRYSRHWRRVRKSGRRTGLAHGSNACMRLHVPNARLRRNLRRRRASHRPQQYLRCLRQHSAALPGLPHSHCRWRPWSRQASPSMGRPSRRTPARPPTNWAVQRPAWQSAGQSSMQSRG